MEGKIGERKEEKEGDRGERERRGGERRMEEGRGEGVGGGERVGEEGRGGRRGR